MGWVRIDDAFYDHDKFAVVGPLGIACWIAGLAFANRNLTNGFIPTRQARRLIDCEGLGIYVGNMSGRDAEPMDGVTELVTAGLWEEVQGGYQIHDYLDYQPSADEVKAQREKNAIRQQKWRERGGSKPSNAEPNASTNAVTDGVSTAAVTGAPNPNPNPSTTSVRGKRPETLRAVPATEPPNNDDEICTRHPNGNPTDEPCRGCQRVEQRKTQRAEAAVEADRRGREEAARTCTRCDGVWLLDENRNITRRKCNHRRTA